MEFLTCSMEIMYNALHHPYKSPCMWCTEEINLIILVLILLVALALVKQRNLGIVTSVFKKNDC